MQQEVLDALAVCGDAGKDAFGGSAGGCINVAPFDADDEFDYSGALGRALDEGVDVMFMYGKQDRACPFVGGYQAALSVPWAGAEAFANQAQQDFGTDGAGTYKTTAAAGARMTWVEVEGAGHMISMNNAAGSSFALEQLLDLGGEFRAPPVDVPLII